MDRAQIEQKVRRIIAEELALDESEVKWDSNLETDLGADSLDRVEIVMWVEEDFVDAGYLEISDEEAMAFKTPLDIVNYVEQHLLKGTVGT